jgi:hypothetical protein
VTSLLIVGAVITIGAGVALGLARAHRLRRQSSKHSQLLDRRERSTAAQEARRSTELGHVEESAQPMPAPTRQEVAAAASSEPEQRSEPPQDWGLSGQADEPSPPARAPVSPEQEVVEVAPLIAPVQEPRSEPSDELPQVDEAAPHAQAPVSPGQEVVEVAPLSALEQEPRTEPSEELPQVDETAPRARAPVLPEQEVVEVAPLIAPVQEPRTEPSEELPQVDEAAPHAQAPVSPEQEVVESEPQSELEQQPGSEVEERTSDREAGDPSGDIPAEPRPRAPQYRPPSRVAPAPGPPSVAQTADTSSGKPESATAGKRAARVELRILFERGGHHCTVSLLPVRPQGVPEECTLSSATGSVYLVALEEEWYQDVVPENIGSLLRTGFVWMDNSTGQEWILAGREIFVLAKGTTHRGFISCPRLVLGREHVVLCTTSRLPEVERILTEAGCDRWSQWGESDGAPAGWTVLCERDNAGNVRGLVPRNPLPLDGADILDVLRPLPEIEIVLEEGVRIGYNSWLSGEPPTVRIYGDVEGTQTVLIDGHEATRSAQGAYTAPGWDETGVHQVWCGGITSKYSLITGESNLRPWPAHSFGRVTICGPLVRPFTDDDPSDRSDRQVIEIATTNPVLLGAQPGEIFIASPRRDVLGARCITSPSFYPIWALPAQPLHCDKESTRVLLIGDFVVPRTDPVPLGRRNGAPAVEHWWRVILEASQKGLSVTPETSAATGLWNQYKRRARELRRVSR